MFGVTSDVVSGFVRHILTTFGGAVVTNGYLTEADWTTVAGGIAIMAGVGWSMISKKLAA